MAGETGQIFILLGALFLAGLAADTLGRTTRLPRVTLLLGIGLIVGRAGFDLVPQTVTDWYEPLSALALTMVAFLLGNSLKWQVLRSSGAAIFWVSISIVVTTIACVALGLWAIGLPLGAALLLGGIATATDPAATRDAILQSGRDGPFATRIEAIVAIDDAWGLIAFALVAVLAQGLNGGGAAELLIDALREVGLAALLGLAVGVPAALLTGRLKAGEPLQSEALGVVFLSAGLALRFEVSFLITGMVAGAVVANFARHHESAFHEIEHIQWPFVMLFFLLAGASLELAALWQIGALGAGYIGLRVLGRLIGGWIGATLGRAPRQERGLYGPALLAQAGVAVGMALVAAQIVPEQADLILTLVIGTTIAFELIGPLATIWAVGRAAPPPQT